MGGTHAGASTQTIGTVTTAPGARIKTVYKSQSCMVSNHHLPPCSCEDGELTVQGGVAAAATAALDSDPAPSLPPSSTLAPSYNNRGQSSTIGASSSPEVPPPLRPLEQLEGRVLNVARKKAGKVYDELATFPDGEALSALALELLVRRPLALLLLS